MNGSASRIAVVFNASLALSLAVVWVHMAVQGVFWRADFTNYYTGWSLVRDGRGDRLYDLELQSRYQEQIVPERGEESGLLPFNYPPHLAVPAALLALLPRGVAFYVWDFAQLLLLLPLFHSLRALTPDPRGMPWAVLCTAVLAFPPLFMSFQMGQVSLLVLICLLGFCRNLAAERPFGTAFWLVLGTIKPQLMVVPAAILLAGRRWRELGIAALLFAVWAALTTAFVGWSCWTDFVQVVRHSAWQFGVDGIYPRSMYNLKGCLTSLLGEGQAASINFVSTAALLLVVLATLWIWRKPWPVGTPEFDLRLALSLQLGLIANPHLNPVDVLALVVPAVLFYRGLRRSGWPVQWLSALFVCGPLLFALDCYGLTTGDRMGVHPFFLLMIALAMVMALTLARLPFSDASQKRPTLLRSVAKRIKTATADAPDAPPSLS
jgi:hypothetical protein